MSIQTAKEKIGTKADSNEKLVKAFAEEYKLSGPCRDTIQALCNRADSSKDGVSSISVYSEEARRCMSCLNGVSLKKVSQKLKRIFKLENGELIVCARTINY